MKLEFLALPDAERSLYIEQAATRRGFSPVIMEKDFWVCWLLAILFESEFAGNLVFKGGTSLSKVFGVIHRFSEDIDLSLSPHFLNLPEAGTSRTQANQWMAKAQSACSHAVRNLIAPVLEAAAHEALGDRGNAWFEFLYDPATHSPVLLFHYPSTQPDGFPYLKRSVKLEFGSLTDQQPTGHHQVAPWIADVLPEAFPDWRCEVVALEVQRTFWEKATILHTEFHRPADKPTPGRFARHYADMATLATHPDAGKAADDDELRSRVVHWKSRFFGSSWARYDEAVRGSFRLVPPPARLSWLRQDYLAMRDMYLSTPASFEDLLATLATLEGRINAIGHQNG